METAVADYHEGLEETDEDRFARLFYKTQCGDDMTEADWGDLVETASKIGLDEQPVALLREDHRLAQQERRNVEAIEAVDGGALRSSRGSLAVIHPSAKYPGQFQVTDFNEAGITGDSQARSIAEAVKIARQSGHVELVNWEEANEALMLFTEAQAQYDERSEKPFLEAVGSPENVEGVGNQHEEAWQITDLIEAKDEKGGSPKERLSDWRPKSISKFSSFASIAENTRVRTSKNHSRQHVIYGNEQAHFWIHRAYNRIYKSSRGFRGLNMSPDQARDFAAEIRAEKELWENKKGGLLARLLPGKETQYRLADAQINALAKTFEDLADKYDRVIYVKGNGTMGAIRGTLYHELTHDSQSQCDEEINKWYSPLFSIGNNTAEPQRERVVANWFWRAPYAEQIAAELQRRGYTEGEYGPESIAHILGGQHKGFNLSLKQAAEFLDSYFANISLLLGSEAMDVYKSLHTTPTMRQILDEAKVKYGSRSGLHGGFGRLPISLPRKEGSEKERCLREPEPRGAGLAGLAGGREAGFGEVSPGTGGQSAERRRDTGRSHLDLITEANSLQPPSDRASQSKIIPSRQIADSTGHEALTVNPAFIGTGTISAPSDGFTPSTFSTDAIHAFPPASINEITIQPLQGRSKSGEELIATLQTIADLVAIDKSGRMSWKELASYASLIARAATVGGAASACDNEALVALENIAGIETFEREGRLLSWKDRVGEAARIASEAIGKIASVEITPSQISQHHESYDQGMGW